MNEVKDKNFKHSTYIALNFIWDNLYHGLIILLYNK